MQDIENVRALIPLCLIASLEVIKRHKERANKESIGMKAVHLSLMGAIISWFSILISLLLLTQLVIDPPSSLYMTFFAFIIFIVLQLVALQNLSLRVYFSDDGLTIRSLFGKVRHYDLNAVIAAKEKRYIGDGNSIVIVLEFENNKTKLPISMFGGVHYDELDLLLKNIIEKLASP